LKILKEDYNKGETSPDIIFKNYVVYGRGGRILGETPQQLKCIGEEVKA
jgi:hypothetical protein